MKEYKEIFPERLKKYCDTLGIRYTDIAEALGVSKAAVSLWASGKTTPKLKTIDQLCELFHCDRQDLLTDEKVSTDYILMQREINGILFECNLLNTDGLRRVKQYAREMAKIYKRKENSEND